MVFKHNKDESKSQDKEDKTNSKKSGFSNIKNSLDMKKELKTS